MAVVTGPTAGEFQLNACQVINGDRWLHSWRSRLVTGVRITLHAASERFPAVKPTPVLLTDPLIVAGFGVLKTKGRQIARVLEEAVERLKDPG